jgi:hypothetical protein
LGAGKIALKKGVRSQESGVRRKARAFGLISGSLQPAPEAEGKQEAENRRQAEVFFSWLLLL